MSTEQNKEIVRRYREAHTLNQLERLDEIVASDLLTHTLLPGLPSGLEGGKAAHQLTLASFPDNTTETVGNLIAEGDVVVERWSYRGTFTGVPFLGILATGRSFSVTGISIYRIFEGKIVEHCAETDNLGGFRQLGILPARGEKS